MNKSFEQDAPRVMHMFLQTNLVSVPRVGAVSLGSHRPADNKQLVRVTKQKLSTKVGIMVGSE